MTKMHRITSTTLRRRPLTAVMVASLALATAAGTSKAQDLSTSELVEALRSGGHVVFIRHATTESDYADQVDAVMGDCSTQRVLSEDGWHEAKRIGEAFDRLGIPVGDVISSQYCRGWQTADLAFGRYEKTADLNFAPAEDYSEEQLAEMRANMVPHLSEMPEDGLNTVLVGHDDPFDSATGIYPEPMGVTFVLEPHGDGGFEILGSIDPDAWPESVD